MEVSGMTALEMVARYYDARQNKRSDFSEVALAKDFRFIGPVASFETAEGYRAMAREAGPAVTSFRVRQQFVDGDTVCPIIDRRTWPTEPPRGEHRSPGSEAGAARTRSHTGWRPDPDAASA
jgi:hypothetical protein